MKKIELENIRDRICDYCFEYCSFMKDSEIYHICSLQNSKDGKSYCKIWDFLDWLYKNNKSEEKDESEQ